MTTYFMYAISLGLLLSLPSRALASANAVSCAAFCLQETTENEKAEKEKVKKVYKFMSFDGPTYGKALKSLYESCDKVNGTLTLEDSPTGDSSNIVVNMKSACRENPK